MTGLPEIRRWPVDRGGLRHIIGQYRGTYAESLCLQSVPVDQLAEDDETAPMCIPCRINHGRELAARHGDRDRYAP